MHLPDTVVHSQLIIDILCTLPMLSRILLGFMPHTELRPNYHRAVFDEHTNLNILDLDGNQTRPRMYIEMPKKVVEDEDNDVNKTSPAGGPVWTFGPSLSRNCQNLDHSYSHSPGACL